MADVTLPQLGETVTEGTITQWFKAVGDTVAADEPLFEVSTDKVDTEVPSPVSGVVSEIRVAEGDTVEVGAVVAIVGDAGDAPAAEPAMVLAGATLKPAVPYPANPNGACGDVAGICDTTGRVLGLMPHPERFIFAHQHPQWTRRGLTGTGDGMKLFENAVAYFGE